MRERKNGMASMPALVREPALPAGYRPPTTRGRPNMHLSEALFATVSRHALQHYVPEIRDEGLAQVLVVQGPFGDGKSTMIDEILRRIGFGVYAASAAQAEVTGKVGGPVAWLEEIVEEVREITAANGWPLAVHFPDFDQSTLSIGSRVDTSVNSQLGRQAWQFMIDEGQLQTASGVPAPIICDGNDFTEMRGSVLRPGRAEFFTHELTALERAKIVGAMFAVEASAVAELCQEHADQPIAFFRDLKVKQHAERFDALYLMHGFDPDAIGTAWRHLKSEPFDLDRLREAARRASQQRARNFTKKETERVEA